MAGKRQKRAAEFIEPFRVKPGLKVTLRRNFDPSFKAGVKKKTDGVTLLKEGVRQLSEYQARLAAQDIWGVLVVLQALDAAGKDGTIRHVMSGVNPRGVAVHGFKVPSAEELDHDFLWRYAQRLPGRGEIGIFNRSYYEEVLVVRVIRRISIGRGFRPKRRRGISGSGATARSTTRSDTDRQRFSDREAVPEPVKARAAQAVSAADRPARPQLEVLRSRRGRTRALGRLSEGVLRDAVHTSTEWAPWYVIPADRKWFGRIGAGAVLLHTLMEINPRFPSVSKQQREAPLEGKASLEAQAPKGAAPDPFEREQREEARS